MMPEGITAFHEQNAFIADHHPNIGEGGNPGTAVSDRSIFISGSLSERSEDGNPAGITAWILSGTQIALQPPG